LFLIIAWRGNKNFVFLYHHRVTANSDFVLLREHLNKLLSLYNTKGCECEVVLFYQNIVPQETQRRIDFTPHHSGLLEFACHTHEIWGERIRIRSGREKMTLFLPRCLTPVIGTT